MRKRMISFLAVLLLAVSGHAKTVEYDLTIEQKTIHINGKSSDGMTINGSIPGPVLHFTDGDLARIRVHNKMTVDTSIHWHGLLVPPGMDGVPNMSFPPIRPGTTFTYEFPIRQSGTYWYHSHTHLQEQQGLYGSIVITPKHHANNMMREEVILFSDWTEESPDTVLRTLKSGSEWYALQKGSSQSILGALKKGELGGYLEREFQRMPPMDIADIAYDYFLANGKPSTVIHAEPGETLRLRMINGSATTYFHLEFSGGPMQIISADGLDVMPFEENRFLVGVAETYDAVITLPDHGAYELRATAHDGSGFASVWIGSGKRNPAPDIPRPNLYMTMDHGGIASAFALTPQGVMGMPDSAVKKGMFDTPGMMGMDHGAHDSDPDQGHGIDHKKDTAKVMDSHHHNGHAAAGHPMDQKPSMDHDQMASSAMDENQSQPVPPKNMHHTDPLPMDRTQIEKQGGKSQTFNYNLLGPDVSSSPLLAADGMGARPWPPYSKLRSKSATAFDPKQPVREIRLTLDGDMERYVWFLDKTPMSASDVIKINEGEIVRFILINRTMMHHPMHLHGHFFRVVNGQGDHAPLKHTVDVAPMATTVIEFNANEVGDWFFHCHLLYHMKSGMARKIHYNNYTPPAEVQALSHNLFKESWYLWTEFEALSNMTEGSIKLADSLNTIELDWEAGWEAVDATHWEGTLTYDRYINRFFSIFGGGFMEGEDTTEEETKGILGIHYLLPLNIESTSWIDHEGEARVMLDKEFELTPRFALEAEVQYDTKEEWETAVGISYLLYKQVSLTVKWHSEYDWGAGLTFRF